MHKSIFTTLLLMTASVFLGSIAAAQDRPAGDYDVTDFGAVGDGETDNTGAFQAALDAAGATGGTVHVPVGNFLIAGNLSIPVDVTLKGTFEAPPRKFESKGSVLLTTSGQGDADGVPFLQMHELSTLKGIVIHYPEQIVSDEPHPYPWTIQGSGDNITIINVLITNPYKAVDLGTFACGRHFVNGLYMQALYRGIFVDKCYDVGRIENVHMWPFWRDDKRLHKFTSEQGIAFMFGRTDWQFVMNCFTIYYSVGFLFDDFGSGPGNVVITQSGADLGPVAVRANQVQTHSGVSFSNCQIMATVETGSENTGPVKFMGCGFWPIPTTTYQAKLQGTGHVFFEGCHFAGWDVAEQDVACIVADGEGLTVTGCDFMQPAKKHFTLTGKVYAAIIGMNRFRSPLEIENNASGDVQMGLNTAQSELIQYHEPPEGAKLFAIDGDHATRSAGWIRYLHPSAFYGYGYWAWKGEGEETFRLDLGSAEAGEYEIQAWIPYDSGKTHATNAAYTVHHAAGTSTVALDQNNDVIRWKSLGTFTIDKDSSIEVSNKGDNNVVADALALIPTGQ